MSNSHLRATKAWQAFSALFLAAMVLVQFMAPKHVPPWVAATIAAPAMDCQNAQIMDTSTLYSVILQSQAQTAPCEAYGCGTGYEWWGVAPLPAGTWRLKVRPKKKVCISLLSACDTLCQNAASEPPIEFDWKFTTDRNYWIHLSGSSAIGVDLEIGRWERASPCLGSYWGPPCKPRK